MVGQVKFLSTGPDKTSSSMPSILCCMLTLHSETCVLDDGSLGRNVSSLSELKTPLYVLQRLPEVYNGKPCHGMYWRYYAHLPAFPAPIMCNGTWQQQQWKHPSCRIGLHQSFMPLELSNEAEHVLRWQQRRKEARYSCFNVLTAVTTIESALPPLVNVSLESSAASRICKGARCFPRQSIPIYVERAIGNKIIN